MATEIRSFSNKFTFLSNFYKSPISVGSKVWPTVEHIYQASKTINEDDQEKIRLATTPGKAKRLGRKVKLQSRWEEKKIDIMHNLIFLKFSQNKELKIKLCATGDTILVEGNYWHDNEWGDCHCAKCREKIGKNMLGKILMKVRRNSQGRGLRQKTSSEKAQASMKKQEIIQQSN